MFTAKLIHNVRPHMLPYFKDGEENNDYVIGQNYYEWYWTYANVIKPTSVLEIGVKWGYSSIAMALGHPGISKLYLYDSEIKVPLPKAVDNIRNVLSDCDIQSFATDTMQVPVDPNAFNFKFDIIHIDGGHTYPVALHDLHWTSLHLADNGIIIIDDTKPSFGTSDQINKAITRFFWDKRDESWQMQYIHTYTGHTILARIPKHYKKDTLGML